MFHDPQSGVWKLRCWCHDKWWTLAEVRAATAYGATRRLTNIERAVWYALLAYEAGLLAPLPIVLPPLAADATAETRRVTDGFALLVGLRWLTHHGQPVPYTLDFAAAWSGVTKYAARNALNSALASRTITQADELVAGARRTRLFLPGDHPDASGRTNR